VDAADAPAWAAQCRAAQLAESASHYNSFWICNTED
jgi:hypothetical protein